MKLVKLSMIAVVFVGSWLLGGLPSMTGYRKPDSADVPVQRGDEATVTVKQTEQGRFTVRVTNVSNRPIFCAYQSGGNDRAAKYFPYVVERLNEKTGSFASFGDGVDFAPRLEEISASKFVEFMFGSADPGVYRIRFSYTVDKEFAEFLNTVHPLDLSQVQREKAANAFVDAISPEMVISVSNPNKTNADVRTRLKR